MYVITYVLHTTQETVKANQADVKRKGRAGRVAPVDFRPAPLVQRGGDRKQRGDRRDGNKYEKRQQKVHLYYI